MLFENVVKREQQREKRERRRVLLLLYGLITSLFSPLRDQRRLARRTSHLDVKRWRILRVEIHGFPLFGKERKLRGQVLHFELPVSQRIQSWAHCGSSWLELWRFPEFLKRIHCFKTSENFFYKISVDPQCCSWSMDRQLTPQQGSCWLKAQLPLYWWRIWNQQ